MTATNLFSVSSFGEFEFWFAGIKVAAIVVFLAWARCSCWGCGRTRRWTSATSPRTSGFFPLGIGAIFSAIVVVIFSMVGAEVATIAAAESPDPGRAIARATNSVITADRGLLRRVDLPARGDPALELRRAGGLAVRRGVPG